MLKRKTSYNSFKEMFKQCRFKSASCCAVPVPREIVPVSYCSWEVALGVIVSFSYRSGRIKHVESIARVGLLIGLFSWSGICKAVLNG